MHKIKKNHGQPLLRSAVQQVDHVSKTIKNGTAKMLDAFVDSAFEFVDQPLLPSQVQNTLTIQG